VSRAFADSNVLLYCFGPEPKAELARATLLRAQVVSVQVLNEFANVARRKLGMSVQEIRQAEADFLVGVEVMPLTQLVHERALSIAERYGFSFYDSLIVAAALNSACTTLYSEDLQHGQIIDSQLQVENPFARD